LLSVDKLSYTGRLKLDKGEGCYKDNRLVDLITVLGGGIYYNFNGNYSRTGFVLQEDGTKAIIQWGGSKTNLKGRFRVEYNPNKLSPQVMRLLKNVGSFADNMDKHGIVTRIDFALDLLEDYNTLEYKYKTGTSKKYFYGRNGKLETVVYGANESDKLIRIYNKAKEQNIDTKWTRIELQLRSDLKPYELNQYVFKDHFKDLEVYKIERQIDILKENKVPIEYKALMLYLELYPEQIGELGRVKREKLKEYKEILQDKIDVNKLYNEGLENCVNKIRREMTGQFMENEFEYQGVEGWN
jgi:hypothetical protein